MRSIALWMTLSSMSTIAATWTSFIPVHSWTCDSPRPFTPQTAIRRRSFAPTFFAGAACAKTWTGSMAPAAPAAAPFRKSRRFRFFIGPPNQPQRHRDPERKKFFSMPLCLCGIFSNVIGDNKRLAIFAREKFVRLGVVAEGFGLARERERAPDADRRLGSLESVLLEVLAHAPPGLVARPAVAEGSVVFDKALLTQAIGDVGEVAERRREMAFEHFRGQALAVPALHGVGEIAEVFAASGEPLDQFAVGSERGRARGARRHEPYLAVEEVAVRDLLVLRGRQPADLLDDLDVAVVEHRDLRVGRRAVVLIAEAAADAEDAPWVLVLSDSPARDVEIVDPVVGHLAAAVVEVPVPVVVEAVRVERPLGRGSLPEVVVDPFRHRRVGQFPDRGPSVVAESPRDLDLAELPRAEEFHRRPQALERARVVPHLDDLVVLARRLDELALLPNVVADRLFDVDVLPRLDRPDRREDMPVVRHRDRDNVDRLAVHQLWAS